MINVLMAQSEFSFHKTAPLMPPPNSSGASFLSICSQMKLSFFPSPLIPALIADPNNFCFFFFPEYLLLFTDIFFVVLRVCLKILVFCLMAFGKR